jgi:hypothetical protein
MRAPMTRFANYALTVVAFVTLGCNAAPSDPTSTTEAEPTTEPAVAAVPEPGGAPKIAADEAVFEFGSIKPTDKVEHVFKIKNTGTADLKIERVQRT